MPEYTPTAELPEVPRLELLSLGMILDKAIHLYVKNFWILIAITAIPQTLMFLINRFGGAAVQRYEVLGSLVYLAVYVVASIVLSGIGDGAMTMVISGKYLGKEIFFAAAYRAAFRKLGIIVAAELVAGLLIFLGMLVIVPGIIFAISYFLISPVVMLENLPATKSRRRSWQLIKGYRWQTLLVVAIYYAAYFGVVYGLRYFILPALAAVEDPLTSSLVYSVSATVLLILLGPFLSVLSILIYYNQRIRKENFDLALLAEAMSKR